MLTLEMLPAGCGDCLWLEVGEPGNTRIVLIDGGVKATAGFLVERIRAALAARRAARLKIDLLIITHYDNDHIEGILELLEKYQDLVSFGDIWFNGDYQLMKLPAPDGLGGGRSDNELEESSGLPADMLGAGDLGWSPADLLGAVQADRLSELLRARGLPWNQAFNGEAAMITPAGTLPEPQWPGMPAGLKLTLLGPPIKRLRKLSQEWQKLAGTFDPAEITLPVTTPADMLGGSDNWPPIFLEDEKEPRDPSVPNGSSIALLLEYQGKALLLTGDAHADDLEAALQRLLKQRQQPRLPLDAFKLPHHGSSNNLSRALIEGVDCAHFLISTDGSRFMHPDQQTLLRLLRFSKSRPHLGFNYDKATTGIWRDKKKDVVSGHFQDYDTAYPKTPGSSYVIKLK